MNSKNLIIESGIRCPTIKPVINLFNQSFCLLPDQIAIPDYPSGATEHWGLITYRVTSLLYDEAEVSSAGKERVAYVVSHELLHNVRLFHVWLYQ